MSAPNTVPVLNSIFQYPPNFPNGEVADTWKAYFQSVNDAINTAPGVLGAVSLVNLADYVSNSQGAALVGWNGGLSYPSNTIGNGLVTEIAARIAADAAIVANLADTSNPANGDALLGVKQPFTGSVARTQHDKNAETISILDFGADPTGATDSHTAIVAALASGAGTIEIPKGNYLNNTDITLPSAVTLSFQNGAKILAGTNGMAVFKTTALTSSLIIERPSISANGKTNVTAFDFTNLSINSSITFADISGCLNGFIFRTGCIAPSLIHPSTWQVPNPVQCLAGTNAITIFHPNFDNEVVNGGTGTGIGVYVNGGNTIKIINGYIQGFQFGVEDNNATYTAVNGTYFEQCTVAAYLLGSVSPIINDLYCFGFGGASAIKGQSAKNALCIGTRMVVSTATVGVFDFDGTNTNCIHITGTDGGTTNTNLGVTTGIKPMGYVTGTFTPVVAGGTTPGTITYTGTPTGTYRQVGNCVDFTINVAWSAIGAGAGDLIISGFPASVPNAGSHYGDEVFQAVMAGISWTGPGLRGYLFTANPWIKIQQISTTGGLANIAIPASGNVIISGRYFTT